MCCRTEKTLLAGFREPFSPEMLQAGVVKGLIGVKIKFTGAFPVHVAASWVH